MIGATIASPAFGALAEEAKTRFVRHTGLPCVVFHSVEESNYVLKFDLLDRLDETVVYFDADLWFIRDCDLSCFDDQEPFIAVRDPGIHDPQHFPFHDAKTLDIDAMLYFNSGFFIANQRHRKAMAMAPVILRKHLKALHDFGEQSAMNAAMQRHSKVRLIDNTYNYLPHAEFSKLRAMRKVSSPITLHAAGYHGDTKMKALAYLEAQNGGLWR